MTDFRRLLLAVCATAALAAVAFSQTPAAAPATPAPANELVPLRGRAPTDADRKVIAQWIAGQIQAANKEPQDLAAFRRAFLNELRANGANEQYRQTFADLSAEAFAKAIVDPVNAQGPGMMANAMMLNILADVNRPSVLPAALDGLRHKADLVRERAATCLLRNRMPPTENPRVFAAVQAAAAKESNGLALRSMCKALAAYGKPEDAAKAALTALETRIQAYENRDCRGSIGDAAVADLLVQTYAQLTPETRQRAVQRLAELLTVAVLNYRDTFPVDPEPKEPKEKEAREARPDQQHLELLIDAVERALTATAKSVQPPAPSVAKVMMGPELRRIEGMQAALDKWIGSAQGPGVLTQAFSVPAGLPKIKLVPSATTRPTTAPKG